MRRIFTGFTLILLALSLLGCGGGTTGGILPGPDDDNTGGNPDTSQPLIEVARPDLQLGDHSVTMAPGQLTVITGGTAAQAEAVMDRHGYELLSFTDGRALVRVPEGAEDAAATTLEKEYNVVRAERVPVINTPRTGYDIALTRGASFTPLDPWYGERGVGLDLNNNGTPDTGDDFFDLLQIFGQGAPMTYQGFNAAWDVALSGSVAVEPVRIAIIDAGWFDYTVVDRPGFDETIIDPAASGSVDAAGTFTAGLAAATWDLDDDGDPTTRDFPFRETGEHLLGVLAADFNSFLPWDIVDFNGDTTITSDEIWNEGIAGINPNATYILIKTGTVSGTNWTFSAAELAESVDHAVAGGANIVLMGMFGNGAVGGALSTALQNARDNNVLVIAPAGDVVASFNGTGFDEAPVDITVSPVTPASDPNVVSVTGTGFNRLDPAVLPDVNGVPNGGTGWNPLFNAPFEDAFTEVADYCNTGATIAGVGFGMGFSFAPFITSGDGTIGNPTAMFPGENYRTTIDRFGSTWAAAYVAGAASQVFQTLASVNGGAPTDDEVLNELLASAQFQPMTGTSSGLLNAGLAMASAINGGNLNQTLPAIRFTGDILSWLSQPINGVTRGTDLTIAPTVANGTAPLELTISWGDGSAPVVVPNWSSGDPVTLTGGYATLGIKGIEISVTDANNLTTAVGIAPRVINPLAASITIVNAGVPVDPANLSVGTTYTFNANPANVFTGTGNTTTFEWDLTGDGTTDATGPVVDFGYTSGLGAIDITLTVTETLRPDTVRTQAVTVN